MTVRVVLVDDEDLIRAGLRAIIDTEPDLAVVGEASDGAEAISTIRTLAPDVVLMDVRMPALDGLQTTRRIVSSGAESSAPKIVVLTTFENDDYVYEALRAGASGFLLKRASPDELVHAIRVVSRGESLLFPSAIRELALSHAVRADAGSPPAGDFGERLTEREAEILRLMARGLSNAEIASELVVSLETVKTHVGNVLSKLSARDRTQAVIAAYESGFVGRA